MFYVRHFILLSLAIHLALREAIQNFEVMMLDLNDDNLT
jgi:hypothetical protein